MRIIIIQARMDSSRLYGKASMFIEGKPSLYHVIKRCKGSKIKTVVATTNRPLDDEIEKISYRLNTTCYRFPRDVDDVLGRHHWVGVQENLQQRDVVIRVTADCLGIESRSILETVEHLKTYSRSSPNHGYPPGYGCEAFHFKALEEAHIKAKDPYDREHVTPYIQRNNKHDSWHINRYDGFNLELNTLEDLERIRHIYGYTPV